MKQSEINNPHEIPKLIKCPDGLYELQYRDGSSIWFYTKDAANTKLSEIKNRIGKNS